MPEVLLLDLDAEERAALARALDAPGAPQVRPVSRGVQPAPSPEGRVVLMGAGAQLLSSLQWAHAALPEARIAVLAPAIDHQRVRRLVQFAPGVPVDLELLDPSTPSLGTRVAEMCAAATRTQEYQEALASYGAQSAGRAADEGPSQVLLGTLLEHAPIGVVAVDAEHRVIGWNRVATELLGCDRSTSGLPVGDLFAHPVPVEALVTAAAAGPVPHETLRVTVVGPDERPLDLAAALSNTEDGRDVVLLLVQDATGRLRVEAERDRYGAHVDMLVGLSEILLSAPDPDTALRQLGVELTSSFADWVTFQAYDARGNTARVLLHHRDPDRNDDARTLMRRLPSSVSDDTPSRRIARGEGPILLRVVTEEMKRVYTPDPEVRTLVDRLGAESALAVPLAGSSGVLGSMVLFRGPESSRFDANDLKVGLEIGRRAGLAFEILEANRRQRLLSEELQLSMLTDPPQLDFADVVARYQPAADEAQVGGDWYDSFIRSDGSLVVTVGDVVGHDVQSAAAMGQVRGLLRGIGYSHQGGPTDVVSALDAAVQSLHPGITATAVVALLSPDEEEPGALSVCWTMAGHPPPVVVRADGSCELMQGSPDLLLGVLPDAERREQAATLRPGDTVLLYSDGLIERRDQDLDEGFVALLDAARELAGAEPEVLCDRLLDRMLRSRQDDDVCLIAFRVR
jgi:serine phosphatase RsbU (regulator of sigma subunit)/PAS domain-containing protein